MCFDDPTLPFPFRTPSAPYFDEDDAEDVELLCQLAELEYESDDDSVGDVDFMDIAVDQSLRGRVAEGAVCGALGHSVAMEVELGRNELGKSEVYHGTVSAWRYLHAAHNFDGACNQVSTDTLSTCT
jgi:hypothetical protein